MNMPKSKDITPSLVARFRQKIYQHYRQHGRTLPWRATTDPYHILVSEIMLQQTQVDRVLPKYELFISTFPDFPSLATAPLREILTVWQGLGYNRRGIALQRIAQRVVAEHGGQLPDTVETLRSFPNIGPATAGAICAFAFNKPAVFIDTNIRRVFIHFFFQDKNGVSDKEILPLVEKTLDSRTPRRWYHALMDYGAMLTKEPDNPNRRSAHYSRQPPFRGSNREIRGQILRTLLERPSLTERELVQSVGKNPKRVKTAITQLIKEGFLTKKGNLLKISSLPISGNTTFG